MKNFAMLFCFCITLISVLVGREKVLIISHHCAQPFFVEIQAKTFEKFIEDEYEFVIFNDGKTPEIAKEIENLCKLNNIRCIRINQSVHDRPYLPRDSGDDYNNPAIRCANVVQYSLDVLGFNYNGPVVIIDSDMFPVKPISFIEYLKEYDLVGVPQFRPYHPLKPVVEYIWNGLVMFNMARLPEKEKINFNCGMIEGFPTDVGGQMHYYLLKHKDTLRKRYIGAVPFSSTVADYRKGRLDNDFNHFIPLMETDVPINMETLLRGKVLHYRCGGKWEGRSQEWYERKNVLIQEFVDNLIHKAE